MKPGIKTVKYIFVCAFCIVCAAGNLSHYIRKAPDASDSIVFFNIERNTDDAGITAAVSDKQNSDPKTIEKAGKIDINSAGVEELTKLPGIGETKARAIISYREAYGGFVAIEEIMEVKGIGPATFEKIRELITIN